MASGLEADPLTAISPVDGRYSRRTEALAPRVSEFGLIRYRVRVEIEWFLHLAALGGVGPPALDLDRQARLRGIWENFDIADARAVRALEAQTNHDVKAVEYFVKAAIARVDESLASQIEFVHFACTSEDINNLAYALMMRDVRETVLLPAMQRLIGSLRDFGRPLADVPMLARTHGQAASPTTAGKEIANVVARLARQAESFRCAEILAKMNGAVGNYNAHVVAYPSVDWPRSTREFVSSLGFVFNEHTTQIEPHDYLAEWFHNLVRFNQIVLDLDRDVWGYIALGYFRQRAVTSETGSSTMPHKVNPIDFENAEGNLGLACAELDYYANKLPISRLQRDLSDSTVLRNMGATLACSTNAYAALERGLGKLDVDAERLDDDLEACPEVLAEAVQTVMKRYGLPDPYEQLKTFTRGQRITQENLAEFISGLDLPDEAKQRLSAMTPRDYIGAAAELARQI